MPLLPIWWGGAARKRPRHRLKFSWPPERGRPLRRFRFVFLLLVAWGFLVATPGQGLAEIRARELITPKVSGDPEEPDISIPVREQVLLSSPREPEQRIADSGNSLPSKVAPSPSGVSALLRNVLLNLLRRVPWIAH